MDLTMQNQYEILIQNLCVEAIIGIFSRERKSPQKVLVNANIRYEKQSAYLDYVALASHIAKCLKKRKYDLLENALDDIIASLKDSYPSITKIDLALQKPDIFAKNIYADSSQNAKDLAGHTNSPRNLDFAGCVLGVRKCVDF
ncbi:dihydroneopterin aldolase [Helicobacter sp. T3_23-1056]